MLLETHGDLRKSSERGQNRRGTWGRALSRNRDGNSRRGRCVQHRGDVDGAKRLRNRERKARYHERQKNPRLKKEMIAIKQNSKQKRMRLKLAANEVQVRGIGLIAPRPALGAIKAGSNSPENQNKARGSTEGEDGGSERWLSWPAPPQPKPREQHVIKTALAGKELRRGSTRSGDII